MTDCKLREHFTKFRIGMSKLNYYIGLRLDTSTVCDMCDLGEDETVEHFLLAYTVTNTVIIFVKVSLKILRRLMYI